MILGFTVSLVLRVLSGEPVLKYNAIIEYYGYVEPHLDDNVRVLSSCRYSVLQANKCKLPCKHHALFTLICSFIFVSLIEFEIT